MLSKHDIKLIRSLRFRRYREEYGLFVVEGVKSVMEVLQSDFEVQRLFCTAEVLSAFDTARDFGCESVTEGDLERISGLTAPNKALAVCALPSPQSLPDPSGEWVIALDGLSDPGNLGTILRLADWFGVSKIFASKNTVDVYNSKTIQASMGSFTRVRVFYTELGCLLKNTSSVVWGACVEGDPVYGLSFPSSGILLMGSEHHGISAALRPYVAQKVSIPKFDQGAAVESLNVAMATAVLLSELRRP